MVGILPLRAPVSSQESRFELPVSAAIIVRAKKTDEESEER
jgi:hypothetical protein